MKQFRWTGQLHVLLSRLFPFFARLRVCSRNSSLPSSCRHGEGRQRRSSMLQPLLGITLEHSIYNKQDSQHTLKMLVFVSVKHVLRRLQRTCTEDQRDPTARA